MLLGDAIPSEDMIGVESRPICSEAWITNKHVMLSEVVQMDVVGMDVKFGVVVFVHGGDRERTR